MAAPWVPGPPPSAAAWRAPARASLPVRLCSPEDEKLLDHPLRRRIHDLLEVEPGISFTELLVRLRNDMMPSLGMGTLTWHLFQLERAGLISSRRSGRRRRFYPRANPWTADTEGLALLAIPGLTDLARRIAAEPGVGQRSLRTMAATVTRQSVSHRLRRLEAHGFVLGLRVGRFRAYEPLPRLVRLLDAMDKTRGPLTRPETFSQSAPVPLPAEEAARVAHVA